MRLVDNIANMMGLPSQSYRFHLLEKRNLQNDNNHLWCSIFGLVFIQRQDKMGVITTLKMNVVHDNNLPSCVVKLYINVLYMRVL